MMKRLYLIILWMCVTHAVVCAQECRVMKDDIRSLRVVAYDDPLLPPIVERSKRWTLSIDFDELSHEYHRYVYHVDLCNADWSVNEEVFESDFLTGLNDQPIEDFDKSFNTTQLYTHYTLSLPNENVRLRLSGNYRVSIYDDDDRDDGPVATAEFCLVDQKMNISAEVSGNTDIDFNDSHQQLSMVISYGQVHVDDPSREIHTVVMQNRRQDMRLVDVRPNYLRNTSMEYTHNRALIFPAGNEFRKFELLDMNKPGMNIDHIRWFDPYFYVNLFEDTAVRNYVYDEDQNGASWIRNEDDEDNNTTCEYAWVNFSLKADKQPSDVYVCGNWTNGTYDDLARMTYNKETGLYEASIYLKQGYYNYQYRTAEGQKVTDERGENIVRGTTTGTDGNFYQTENEYIILVYHRAPTSRTDDLVGYRRLNTRL